MSFVTHASAPLNGNRKLEVVPPESTGNYDAVVRANIQEIRTNLLSIQQNLSNLNRNFISRRIVESLYDKLKKTFEIVVQTENTFKIWLDEQRTDSNFKPALSRQREKFLFDKLFAHFQTEIKRVQELSDQVREAAERAADPVASAAVETKCDGNPTVAPAGVEDRKNIILDIEYAGAYGESAANEDDMFFLDDDQRDITEFDTVAEHEALLARSVSEDRYLGIRRIHSQVSQANQIFKDLANLIFHQGEAISTIATQMHDAHAHSKAGLMELQKASRVQQRSRQRRCYLMLFICVLAMLILYSLNAFSIFAIFQAASSGSPTRVAIAQKPITAANGGTSATVEPPQAELPSVPHESNALQSIRSPQVDPSAILAKFRPQIPP